MSNANTIADLGTKTRAGISALVFYLHVAMVFIVNIIQTGKIYVHRIL